ncbi:pyrroline-5-carboxylate reductase [Seiridium cupressi]
MPSNDLLDHIVSHLQSIALKSLPRCYQTNEVVSFSGDDGHIESHSRMPKMESAMMRRYLEDISETSVHGNLASRNAFPNASHARFALESAMANRRQCVSLFDGAFTNAHLNPSVQPWQKDYGLEIVAGAIPPCINVTVLSAIGVWGGLGEQDYYGQLWLYYQPGTLYPPSVETLTTYGNYISTREQEILTKPISVRKYQAENEGAKSDGSLYWLRGTSSAQPPKWTPRFIACTNTKASADRLEQQMSRHRPHVEVLYASNVRAMSLADVIVLGIKPYFAKGVLQEAGVREAVAGKLIISLLAGGKLDELRSYIQKDSDASLSEGPWLVKTIPNVAVRYRESMTLMEEPNPPLPRQEEEFVFWFWNMVGTIKVLRSDLMNAGTMVTTSCLAALSVPLDGILDGAVHQGLRRHEATDLAVQSLKSLVAMLEQGTHPAVLRESISSPRGCTIVTLLSIEKAGTRGAFAQALIDGVQLLDKLDSK